MAREPGRLEDAQKFQRSENGESEGSCVKEHVPDHFEIAETQNLQNIDISRLRDGDIR